MTNLAGTLRKIGRVLFILMWIPAAGTFFGMLGLPEGSYDWADLPLLVRVSLIALGVFGVGAMVLMFGSPLVGGLQDRALLQNGLDAQAAILEVQPTGMVINNYHYGVGLLLEVRPPGGAPFQARIERLVPVHL